MAAGRPRPALALHDLGVAHGRSGQNGAGSSGVQLAQLAQQNRERPEIGHEVVDREHQHAPGGVLRPAMEQHRPHDGPGFQVERAERRFVDPRAEHRGAPARGVFHRPHRGGGGRRRMDVLERAQGAVGKGRPQGGVALDEPGEGAAESLRIDAFGQPCGSGDGVGRARRCQPLQDPQRLLAERERKALALRAPSGLAAHGGTPAGGGKLLQLLRRLGDRAAGQQVRHRERDAELRFDRMGQLDRSQGVEPERRHRLPAVDARGIEPHDPGERRVQEVLDRASGLCDRGRQGDGRVSQGALPHDREPVAQVELAAAVALHLAAGSPGQGGRADQDQIGKLHLVLFGQAAAHRRGDLLDRETLQPVALGLEHHHQALFAEHLDRKSGATPGAQGFMRALRGELQVLRIVIAAPQNDQILAPAGDVELALAQETEVARAQERAAAVRQPGAQLRLARLRASPVSRCHAGSGDPDLADLLRRAGDPGLGIDDQHLLIPPGAPAAHQPLGGTRSRCVHRRHPRPFPRTPPGDEQRRLGQAVAGIERLAGEAAGGEGRGEPLKRVGAHRLGAVERHRPAAQIKPLPRLRADLLQAQLVGEIGTPARRRPVAGNRLQPAPRPLQEGRRRHQDATAAAEQRLEHVPDQAHVVVERQPAQHHGVLAETERLADHPLVVQQAGMGDHDALGQCGRARGVLKKRRHVGRGGPRNVLGGCDRGVHVQGQPPRCLQGRLPPQDLGRPGEQRRRRQHHARPGVLDDGAQPGLVPPRPGRVRRHRHHPGVQAGEKGDDEVEARRVEQQGAISGRGVPQQDRSPGARPAIELAPGQPRRLGLALGEEEIGRPIRGEACPFSQDVAETLGVGKERCRAPVPVFHRSQRSPATGSWAAARRAGM